MANAKSDPAGTSGGNEEAAAATAAANAASQGSEPQPNDETGAGPAGEQPQPDAGEDFTPSRHVVLTKASRHGHVGALISLPLTLVDELVKGGKARFAKREDFGF
jgi:hypothetical protein